MVKINHKKSEFGLNYNNVYRSVDNYWRNNWETFRYEDGSSFTRVEDGIPSRISTYGYNIGLNYSFRIRGNGSLIPLYGGLLIRTSRITKAVCIFGRSLKKF